MMLRLPARAEWRQARMCLGELQRTMLSTACGSLASPVLWKKRWMVGWACISSRTEQLRGAGQPGRGWKVMKSMVGSRAAQEEEGSASRQLR